MIHVVVLVGFVCFLCPGMFNALNGFVPRIRVPPEDLSDSFTAWAVVV